MPSAVAEAARGGASSSPPGEPTWEVAHLFPIQGEWSEAEYLALNTNRLVELVDGRLEVLPVATLFHQLIVEYLRDLLKAFVTEHSLGRVLTAPLPIRLWPGRLREPDILFLKPHRMRELHGQPDGADLVMEVVSEGTANRARDFETKRLDYARAGIPGYWIVDPLERKIVVLTLEGQSYRVHGEFGPGMVATSVLLPGFVVTVDQVFAAA